MKREALSLVVSCPNCNNGCVWKGEVRNVEVNKSSKVYIVDIIVIVITILTSIASLNVHN